MQAIPSSLTISLSTGSSKSLEIVTTPEAAAKYMPKPQEGLYKPKSDRAIYIITRHGENIFNTGRQRYDGRTLNGRLTDKGHVQAKEAGQVLKGRVAVIDTVLINKMDRTRESAKEILESFNPETPMDDNNDALLERSIGTYEGCFLDDPDYDEQRKKDIAISNDHTLSFTQKMAKKAHEQFESFGAVGERAANSLVEKSETLKGKVALVVTHSGTMRGLYWLLCANKGFYVPYNSFRPQNSAYMIVEAVDGKLNLLETNRIDIAPIK